MSSPPEIERMRRSTLYFAAPFLLVFAIALLAILVDEHGLNGPAIAGLASGAVVVLALAGVLIARRNVRPAPDDVERAQATWLSMRTGIVGAGAAIGLGLMYALRGSPDLEAFAMAFFSVLFIGLAPLAWVVAYKRRGLLDRRS